MSRIDQALSFHLVEPNTYELSGLRTGSVRDQMIRAFMLVERLVIQDAINDTTPLLILGGGAAGITAGLTAIALGVQVDLVEQHPGVCQTQLGVRTRWLDPVEYDWPHAHWSQGAMAWHPPAPKYPLNYVAGFAHDLAKDWQALWNNVVVRTPSLVTQHQGDAANIKVESKNYGVLASNGPFSASGKAFGAAISCIGFSGEKVSVTSTTGLMGGPAFWSTDQLTHPTLGLARSSTATIHVLVSGSGDGAQQDFVRILTGYETAKDLYLALKLDTQSFDHGELMMADDEGRRSYAWSMPDEEPKRDLLKWHARYEKVIDGIWNDWISNGAVSQHVKLLRPNIHATWLVGSNTPGYCFGMNRILSGLVSRLHEWQTKRPLNDGETALANNNAIRIWNARVTDVAPTNGHACGHGCYDQHHHVNVKVVDKKVVGSGLGNFNIGSFDVIVIRHGVNQKPFFGSVTAAVQAIPFDVPS